MIWLGNKRGHLTDWLTQRWVCLTGRRIIYPECDWLLGPSGSVRGIGGDFFDQLAAATNSRMLVNAPNRLLEDFGLFDGSSFESDQVHPEIIRFYESTSDFALDAWCEWVGAFKPFGSMLRLIFSRRLQQLNVRDKIDQAWARYVHTMKETIHIYMGERGELRADHVLKIWGFVFLRLHYRITLKSLRPEVPTKFRSRD